MKDEPLSVIANAVMADETQTTPVSQGIAMWHLTIYFQCQQFGVGAGTSACYVAETSPGRRTGLSDFDARDSICVPS